jgi:predicted hotdog family 3-hydroxylacyl-ACP dehydratase
VLIGKPGVARLLPHAGAMCLIESVLSYDEALIRCTATSHQAMDNPLRRDGRLGALCGVEYAAQAMALHGALASRDAQADPVPARAGYLASLRAVEIHVDRLDLLAGPLIVEAERLQGDGERAVYRFTLHHQDRVLLTGRAAVSLTVA